MLYDIIFMMITWKKPVPCGRKVKMSLNQTTHSAQSDSIRFRHAAYLVFCEHMLRDKNLTFQKYTNFMIVCSISSSFSSPPISHGIDNHHNSQSYSNSLSNMCVPNATTLTENQIQWQHRFFDFVWFNV